MLRLFRIRRKARFRWLATALAGIWLMTVAAPCVIAMPHCPPGMVDGYNPAEQHVAVLSAPDICITIGSLDCQGGGSQVLTISAATPDLAHAPALLVTLSAVVAFPDTMRLRQYTQSKARIPDKPLNLKHAVLLL